MYASQARAKIAEFNAKLERQGQVTAEKMAVTGISLVVERLQRDGVAGASYSDQRLPAWYVKDKALNAGGRSYYDEHAHPKKVDGKIPQDADTVTWGEFRAANGLQNSHVDLTFSGRMLGGWVVLSYVNDGTGKFTARTGGTDDEIDAKLFYQVARYGAKVFELTEAEQAEIDEIAQDDMIDFLTNFFS